MQRIKYLAPFGLLAGLAFAFTVADNTASGKSCCAAHKLKSCDVSKISFLDKANAPKGDGWISLINDNNLTGWTQRKRGEDKRPMTWIVSNGTAVCFSTHDHRGVDIVSEQKFDDFEIYYEYLIPPGSNSGLYLRGRYEIQILEDHGKDPNNHSNGGLFSTCPPKVNASKKPYEWQTVRAKIVGKKIDVTLNGTKTVDNFEVTKHTGGALDENYGTPGPIMIQGDHGSIMVRNLFVKPTKK